MAFIFQSVASEANSKGRGGGARLIKIQNLDKQNEGLWLWLRITLHAKKIVLPLQI